MLLCSYSCSSDITTVHHLSNVSVSQSWMAQHPGFNGCQMIT